MAVAGDEALAVLPGGSGLLLFGLDDDRAFLVALTPRKLHAVLVDGRRMTEWHVIGVEHILDLQLPVTVEGVPVHAGIERQLTVRCAIDQVVDIVLHRADMVFEARPLGGEAREYEAAVLADARRAGEPECFLVE